MKKKIISILIALGMMTSFAGCKDANKNLNDTSKNDKKVEEKGKEKSSQYPLNIKNYDADGNEYELKIDKKPEKIITTNQTTTELLLTLGLGKNMVGTAYLDNPVLPELKAEYDKIPVLSEKYPSKEVIISKKPDAIVGWSSAFFEKNLGDVKTWNEKGMTTFIQRNTLGKKCTVDNIYKDIEDLGKIFDIENKANEVITSMKKRVEDVQSKIKGKKEAKVLVVEGISENKYYAYGQNSLVNDMVKMAGGVNVETNEKGGEYSAENILNKNPDVIVLIHFETQVKDNKEADALLNNKALKDVNAIKNKKIIYTPLAETYAGGARTINGIERLAKGFYPELFK